MDQKGKLTALSHGRAMVILEGPERTKDSLEIQVYYKTELHITNIPEGNQLRVGDPHDLSYIFVDSHGGTYTEKEDAINVTWSVDDKSILEVDEKGNITTHTPGVATITVTTGGPNKNSDRVTITVVPGENEVPETPIKKPTIAITNAPKQGELLKGASQDLNYLYTDEDGESHTEVIDPVEVTWSIIGDKTILELDRNSGKVRALKPGKTKVKVVGPDGATTDLVTIVVVREPAIAIVHSLGNENILTKGKSHDLDYNYTDENDVSHSDKNLPVNVQWSVVNQGDEKVLSIDSNTGDVTALKPGTATVKVVGPKSTMAEITIQVIHKPTIVITNGPQKLNLTKIDYELEYLYTDENELPHTKENSPVDVKWEVVSETILGVDDNGKVTPKKLGKTQVTVIGPGGERSKSIDIKIVQDPTLVITNPIDRLKTAAVHPLGYKYTDEDGKVYTDNKAAKWSSTDTALATVGTSNGVVTAGNTGGKVTIEVEVEGKSTNINIIIVGKPSIRIETNGQTGFNPRVRSNSKKQWGYVYTDENGDTHTENIEVEWKIDHIPYISPQLEIKVKGGLIDVPPNAIPTRTYNVSVMLKDDNSVSHTVKIKIGIPCVKVEQPFQAEAGKRYKFNFYVINAIKVKLPDSEIDRFIIKSSHPDYIIVDENGDAEVFKDLKGGRYGKLVAVNITIKAILKNGMASFPHTSVLWGEK